MMSRAQKSITTRFLDFAEPTGGTTAVTLTCSRCNKQVTGWTSAEGSAGFYYVNTGYFVKFRRGDEVAICDPCMWADSGYKQEFTPSQHYAQEKN